MTILKTKRLTLREFELSDAKSLYELNSNPEVIKYTGDPPFKKYRRSPRIHFKLQSLQEIWLWTVGSNSELN